MYPTYCHAVRGYYFAAVTGSDERVRRTVAIEVVSWPTWERATGGVSLINENLTEGIVEENPVAVGIGNYETH